MLTTGSALMGILTAVCALGFTKLRVESSVVPLPPSLTGLPIIEAEPWLQIDADPDLYLEGPAFNREGNLFVTSILDGRVLKITPGRKVTTILSKKGLLPDGTAIHKDGRLLIACLSGEIVGLDTDGSNLTYIEARYQGKPQVANDLVFDSQGNLYVTDFTGTIANPTGGVYRFSADFNTVEPVIEQLASANGISLAPEGNVLWVSETTRNEILRLELLEDGITIKPMAGATVPYRFTGGPGGPDSMAVDIQGNVYQCLIFQGRVLILNKAGIPVANVLIPGRDEGKYLRTTNLAFKPGTNEVFITTSGEGGAWIYTFCGLAEGVKLFSHQ